MRIHHITMYFLVACQFIMALVTALTPAQRNSMVVSRSPNQRYANELSNRSSRDPPTSLLDYTNTEGTRRWALESRKEGIPAEVQRSISMTLEQLLIERPNASGSFDYGAKKPEITTADTIFTKTDDRRSRFFVNQTLERGGNQDTLLKALNVKSVTENGKELQSEAVSLKKRATGNTTIEGSSRKETTEVLSRKIEVGSSDTADLKDKGIPITGGMKSGKESRQLISELFEDTQALHQQTTNSKAMRTHLKQNKRTTEENNIPEALPLRRSNAQHHINFASPLSASSRKRNSRFSRQNSIQLNAAAAYQKALKSLQIGSTDLSGKTSITGVGPREFRFNPAQINNIKGVFDTIPLKQGNFRKIPSDQVAFIPPKIIYETRILPAPFMTVDRQQKEFRGFPNFFTPDPDSKRKTLDFTGSNDQKYSAAAVKDAIPVSEKSQEFVNTFVTPLPIRDVSFPPIVNEISNHRYEAAVPIIKSTALNHRPNSVDVEKAKAEYTPAPTEHSEYIEVKPDFSNSEELEHDAYSRISNPLYAGKYTFGYRVTDHETGNDFGHEERRYGDITKGRYHVLLPDGRIQNVNYHVDREGYHAKVSYHYDH